MQQEAAEVDATGLRQAADVYELELELERRERRQQHILLTGHLSNIPICIQIAAHRPQCPEPGPDFCPLYLVASCTWPPVRSLEHLELELHRRLCISIVFAFALFLDCEVNKKLQTREDREEEEVDR